MKYTDYKTKTEIVDRQPPLKSEVIRIKYEVRSKIVDKEITLETYNNIYTQAFKILSFILSST